MKQFLNRLLGGDWRGWKRRLWQGAVLLLVAALGGCGVMLSGVVPVAASSGHWPVTAWLLEFSMSRSVATHSLGIDPPPLDDPRLVLQGAGHYALACAPCHGRPDLHHPRIAAAMTPPPPYLAPNVGHWETRELFYIVKHGVKFTGMPAWPAQQRDDEVWAVVAFLLKLPELDAEEYHRLTGRDERAQSAGDADSLLPAVLLRGRCAMCHGGDGMGRESGAFPTLAGQSRDYLAATLRAYAERQRSSGFMEPVAAGLSAAEIDELAGYFSRLEPVRPSSSDSPRQRDAESIARGAALAQGGADGQRVPACIECHAAGRAEQNPAYPLLIGQNAEFLHRQLELFENRKRGGTGNESLMHPVVDAMSPQDMLDAAAYYESLGP